LLKELPSKFNGIIRPKTCNTVEEIWRKFYIIYAMITCKKPTAEMMTDYHGKTKEWINLFISLRDKMNGYKKANINIPKFFELYKTVKVFTGQGIERNNDVARNIVKFLKRSLIVNLLKHELSTASLQSSTGK
jgi:hypothetical protein